MKEISFIIFSLQANILIVQGIKKTFPLKNPANTVRQKAENMNEYVSKSAMCNVKCSSIVLYKIWKRMDK